MKPKKKPLTSTVKRNQQTKAKVEATTTKVEKTNKKPKISKKPKSKIITKRHQHHNYETTSDSNSSSSENSENEDADTQPTNSRSSHNRSAPNKRQYKTTQKKKTKAMLKKSNDDNFDLRDVGVTKRMASLNASAMLAATYEVERHLDRCDSTFNCSSAESQSDTPSSPKRIKDIKHEVVDEVNIILYYHIYLILIYFFSIIFLNLDNSSFI